MCVCVLASFCPPPPVMLVITTGAQPLQRAPQHGVLRPHGGKRRLKRNGDQ